MHRCRRSHSVAASEGPDFLVSRPSTVGTRTSCPFRKPLAPGPRLEARSGRPVWIFTVNESKEIASRRRAHFACLVHSFVVASAKYTGSFAIVRLSTAPGDTSPSEAASPNLDTHNSMTSRSIYCYAFFVNVLRTPLWIAVGRSTGDRSGMAVGEILCLAEAPRFTDCRWVPPLDCKLRRLAERENQRRQLVGPGWLRFFDDGRSSHRRLFCLMAEQRSRGRREGLSPRPQDCLGEAIRLRWGDQRLSLGWRSPLGGVDHWSRCRRDWLSADSSPAATYVGSHGSRGGVISVVGSSPLDVM